MALSKTLSVHGGKQPSAPSIALALDVSLDASYPTGGYDFDAGAVLQELGKYDKPPEVLNVIAEPKGGYSLEYDRSTKKLKALQPKQANVTLSSAGLAIGSVSKKEVLIGNTVTFAINGVILTKTTAEVGFTATVHDIAPDASNVQEAVYLLSLNAAGAATITKGPTATGAGNAAIPDTPAGQTAIGYVRIAIAAGATPFDATSDDLDAAHITDTYVNLAHTPQDRQAKEVENGTDLSGVTNVPVTIYAH